MVVSGQVTPDNIMLDKVMLAVVAEHLGDKHAELVPDAAAGRLVEREVDAERRGRRCLTDAELTAVATMAKRAEKHYRCPQDIEWALDARPARRREPAAAAVPPGDRPFRRSPPLDAHGLGARRLRPRPAHLVRITAAESSAATRTPTQELA